MLAPPLDGYLPRTRADRALLASLARAHKDHAARVALACPGARITLADTVRALLLRGLATLDSADASDATEQAAA